MTIVDWIPSLTISGALAGALGLLGHTIMARLEKSIEHKFDNKLETIKSEFRAKEQEIESLRGGAMSALISRQVALDKRRIEAVDQIWAAVSALAPARTISQMMSTVNYDAASKQAEYDPKIRELFKTMGAGQGHRIKIARRFAEVLRIGAPGVIGVKFWLATCCEASRNNFTLDLGASAWTLNPRAVSRASFTNSMTHASWGDATIG